MTRRLILCMLLLAAAVLVRAGAGEAGAAPPKQKAFDEAELFFELNDTDGDLGIHGSIDGGPWETLEIDGPRDRALLAIVATGALRQQGMTQLFFESAEPGFDELDPGEFFARFPEGRYEISGRAQGGGELESVAVLSHILPAPPGGIFVNTLPAAEDCDANPLPAVHAPVTIDWEDVTSSHPEIGRSGPVRIVRYQFFVEVPGTKLSVDLPPSVTAFEIPVSVTPAPGVYKFEIIARSSTGNNTAVESCFRVM